MTAPRAPERLQLHSGFTFADATRLVPYLVSLGISHVYTSPILTARAGSMHGYDVVDPTQVNPELGGEAGLRSLVAALHDAGLGIIVDIVPNHMAAGGMENAWWADVLLHGQTSRYASFFDIDWNSADPALRDKVLAPFLGEPYGESLRSGAITLAREDGAPVIRYYDNRFPIRIADHAEIAVAAPDAYDPATEAGRARLHALLERQHYRLAWWRTAGDEINWRRFFDINGLAALRIEDEAVFEATHATLFRLCADGLIDGLRVDHVDGLADPPSYCRRLRERLGGRAWPVVEKILGPGERLPDDWKVDGTSGYDFMDQVARLLHDPAGEAPLNRLWAAVSGRSPHFAEEEVTGRRELLERSFAAQLDAAVAALHRLAIADLSTRDLTAPAIHRALVEILVHLRAYRTYRDSEDGETFDQGILACAVAKAKLTCLRSDLPTVERLAGWLDGQNAASDAQDLQAEAIRRFQQLSAPLAAKAVEDTAFYRYGRLLSRLDVGFDAERFAISVPAFHEACRARLRQFPDAMLATATHDHKRGEDMRARLAVLSEIAGEWAAKAKQWIDESAPLRQSHENRLAPARGDIAILLQTIVGAWPLALGLDDREGLASFASRIADWQLKALREAKLATDWTTPDEIYEAAARGFVERLFADEIPGLVASIGAFAQRIAPAGAVNGLTQTLLKLTAPGVPDIYQGAEFWDFSLVDPDNRRPVDFDVRRNAIDARASMAERTRDWRSGHVKQAVARNTLGLRRERPELFARGDYEPLTIEGPRAANLIAFRRRFGDEVAVVVACRLPMAVLEGSEEIGLPSSVWDATWVRLPSPIVGRDVLTGEAIAFDGQEVAIGRILKRLPTALLTNG